MKESVKNLWTSISDPNLDPHGYGVPEQVSVLLPEDVAFVAERVDNVMSTPLPILGNKALGRAYTDNGPTVQWNDKGQIVTFGGYIGIFDPTHLKAVTADVALAALRAGRQIADLVVPSSDPDAGYKLVSACIKLRAYL